MRWFSTFCVAAAMGFVPPSVASAALIDQRGLPFALAAQRQPVILTFIATRCTDACPLANAAFSAAVAKTRRARLGATFVTATLDPAYDTPFVMAEYARRLGADARLWRFVSGPRADVDALLRRFGVVVSPNDHSSLIYLVGTDGTVQTLFLSSDAPERILEVLKKAEKRNA